MSIIEKPNGKNLLAFKVLGMVHKSALFNSLVPPAIKAAKNYKGKILQLSRIEPPLSLALKKAEEKKTGSRE